MNNSNKMEVVCREPQDLPSTIECLYFDKTKLYQQNVARVNNDNVSHNNKLVINSNIVSSGALIKDIIDNINVSYLDSNYVFKFCLPYQYIYLEPGDLIDIEYNNTLQTIKITNINRVDNGIFAVEAISSSIRKKRPLLSNEVFIPLENINIGKIREYVIEILDISNFQNIYSNAPLVYVAIAAKSGEFKPVQVEYTDTSSNAYQYSEFLTKEATIGIADCNGLMTDVIPGVIDYVSKLHVYLTSGALSSMDYPTMAIEYNKNLVLVDNEIIQFITAKQIGSHEYILSGLKRGCLGTEHLVSVKKSNHERFILLDNNLHAIELPLHVYKNICRYRIFDEDLDVHTNNGEFLWQARSIAPLSPVNIQYDLSSEKILHINWHRRAKASGLWLNHIEVPLDYPEEKYAVFLKNDQGDDLLYKEVMQSNIKIDLNKIICSQYIIITVCQISPFIGSGNILEHRLHLE